MNKQKSDAWVQRATSDLLNAKLMNKNDQLIDFFQTSCWSSSFFGLIPSWRNGWGYFTKKSFIQIVGFGEPTFVIPYNCIKSVERCTQFFLPLGLKITYHDSQTNTLETLRISLRNRTFWFNFLVEKSANNKIFLD